MRVIARRFSPFRRLLETCAEPHSTFLAEKLNLPCEAVPQRPIYHFQDGRKVISYFNLGQSQDSTGPDTLYSKGAST